MMKEKKNKTSEEKGKKEKGRRVDFYDDCIVGMRKQKNKRYGVRCLLVRYVFFILESHKYGVENFQTITITTD
jgi:hypothetical protein